MQRENDAVVVVVEGEAGLTIQTQPETSAFAETLYGIYATASL